MSHLLPPHDIDRLLAALRAGRSAPDPAVAERLAALPPEDRAAAVGQLLPEPAGRRWLREAVLPRMGDAAAAALAARLLAYREDFVAERRDRTTGAVVRALAWDALVAAAPFLAGSNAAGALWERLAARGGDAVRAVALRVLAEGETLARETTLYLLLRDPFGPVSLAPDDRRAVLLAALADPDDEIRGLAAEVAVAEFPEALLADLARWVRDPAPRARAVAWELAFTADAERAVADAVALLAGEEEPLAARRSALLALGERLATAEMEPVLIALVRHPVQALAEDAAALLWERHRTPAVAQAAAESPFPAVREIAQRLLDPRRGSPMAGGFRPGAEAQGYGFYGQLRRREGEG
ncbi:MAG: hypothetical protein QJR03_02990 [Sphaerobacter sp.]|nr:hypothetical protein [Sphaerobacter sp.]